MNKYLAFTALALACLTSVVLAQPMGEITAEDDVASEVSLTPSDDEEVAGLQGLTLGYTDFCISYRDYVLGDINSASNNMAARLFTLFFNGAEKLGLEAVDVQREAADKLGNQIRNPEAPIAAVGADSNEVDSIIADGQRNIQANQAVTGGPRNLFQGIVSALAATKNVVTSHVLGRLNQLKTGLDLATFTGSLKDACERIAQYDQELVQRFEATRKALASQGPAFGRYQLEDIDCVTARRIIRLDGICKFAAAAQSPLIQIISYKPIAEPTKAANGAE